jgi:hypothetical protein
LTSAINRRAGPALAVALISAALFTPDARAEESGMAPPKPVIELFTSQGCDSCPPADALLGKYIARGDVIALSLPVDYWDYLGWRDTLASPKYSNRQRSYARARRDGDVYTPQVVVNGVAHAVGSDGRAVERALAKTQGSLNKYHVPLKIWAEGNEVIIEAGAAPEGAKPVSGTFWLALIKKEASVSIKRGENRGKQVTYHNVVRDLTPVGKYSGKPETLTLPKRDLMRYGADGCTVLLQMDDAGPIIAAAEMKDW